MKNRLSRPSRQLTHKQWFLGTKRPLPLMKAGAKIPHKGGVSGLQRTCKELFTEVASRLPERDPDSPTHAEVPRSKAASLLNEGFCARGKLL